MSLASRPVSTTSPDPFARRRTISDYRHSSAVGPPLSPQPAANVAAAPRMTTRLATRVGAKLTPGLLFDGDSPFGQDPRQRAGVQLWLCALRQARSFRLGR